METTSPATYAQRQEKVAEVLALFYKDKQWYLDHFAKLLFLERFEDVGLIDDNSRPVEERDWLVRFDREEQRIICIWREDPMLLHGMSTGLKQEISIPT